VRDMDGVNPFNQYIVADKHPLIVAAKANDPNHIKAAAEDTSLTAAQRDPNFLWQCLANSTSKFSALHVATDCGNTEAMSALLQIGGDVHVQSEMCDKWSGYNSVKFAQYGALGLKGGHSEDEGREILEGLLCEHGIVAPKDGVYMVNDYLASDDFPLVGAAKDNNAAAIHDIVADTSLTPDQRNPDSQWHCVRGRGNQHTALHVAVDLGNLAAIRALLKRGADPHLEAAAIWGGPYDSFRFAREGVLGKAGGHSEEEGESTLDALAHIVLQIAATMQEECISLDCLDIAGQTLATLTLGPEVDSAAQLQTLLHEKFSLRARAILPNGRLLQDLTEDESLRAALAK